LGILVANPAEKKVGFSLEAFCLLALHVAFPSLASRFAARLDSAFGVQLFYNAWSLALPPALCAEKRATQSAR